MDILSIRINRFLFCSETFVRSYSDYSTTRQIYFSAGSILFDHQFNWIICGILPFFVIIYGIFRTVYRFKIYRIQIPLKTLPAAFEGLRIVQISDLHLGSFNYRYSILERAVHLINHLQPDYVFFTGDLVNNYAWELKGWNSTLKKIKAHHGKIAVLGNHDYGDYSTWDSDDMKRENFRQITDFFSEISFTLLRNDSVILSRAGDKIAVIGVENWGKPRLNNMETSRLP